MLTYFKNNFMRLEAFFISVQGECSTQHLKGWYRFSSERKICQCVICHLQNCPQRTKASSLPLLKAGLLKHKKEIQGNNK